MATRKQMKLVYSAILLLTMILTGTGDSWTSSEKVIRTIYVIPSTGNGSHLKCPNDLCYSLQDIVGNKSTYFTSNTALELIPGVYNIYKELNLHLTNATNFVIKASDVAQHVYGNNSYFNHTKVEIRCKQNSTFRMTLYNCSNVMIKDITFSHCITKGKSDYIFHINRCFNVTLFNTAFNENKGAVLIQKSKIKFRGRSVFYNNLAKDCESFLIINESSEIRITGETHFVGNTAESGGAFLVYSSTVNLDNKRVYFIRNTASSGGAIALKNQSIFNTNVEMTVFRENKAN